MPLILRLKSLEIIIPRSSSHDHDQLCASRPSPGLPVPQTYDTNGILSKTTFSFASYANFRPSYPSSLFRTILDFHHHGQQRGASPSRALLDIGCGHGVVARALSPHFPSATAIDPSAGMVAQAKRLSTDPDSNSNNNTITFRQAGAEDLSFLADGSVDLAVAGQAAHWFDYKRAWPELARVVRRQGGSLAFWGYKDNVIVGYPQLFPIYRRFVYGSGEVRPGLEGLGRFWENPGRTVLRDSFAAIVPPETDWEEVTRSNWEPDDSPTGGIEKAPEEALWLRKQLKLGEYEGYLRTYSSFNNWKAEYPDKKSKAEGGDGDVVDAMFEAFVDAVPEWQAAGEGWREVEVECVWGTCLLMARRKSK